MIALAASAVTVVSLAAAPAQAAPLVPAAPLAGLAMDFGCATPSGPSQVHCLGKMRARLLANGRRGPQLMAGPTGFGPADLESAYKVAGLKSGGRTVAIVNIQRVCREYQFQRGVDSL